MMSGSTSIHVTPVSFTTDSCSSLLSGDNPIIVGFGAVHQIAEFIRASPCLSDSTDLILIAEAKVSSIFGPTVRERLLKTGKIVHDMQLSVANGTKDINTLQRVYDYLMSIKADGGTLIIALGGGVLIDVVGFAAATFHRGLNYIAVPTTLVAQIDGAIGGTVGIHYGGYTNYVGMRYLPQLVVVDPALLETLPWQEFRCGLAEIIKQCVVSDSALFEHLSRQSPGAIRDRNSLTELIWRVIRGKADLLRQGTDWALNFGHTIGQAVENLAGHDRIRHGEAVSIGMVGAAYMSSSLRLMSVADSHKISAILQKFTLPIRVPTEVAEARGLVAKDDLADRLLASTKRDKKSKGGALNWIIPTGIGSYKTMRVEESVVKSTLFELLCDLPG
ncbi:MAG: 3-dehydroquinate synthase family protein [Pyrinomonadaceae bacterium]